MTPTPSPREVLIPLNGRLYELVVVGTTIRSVRYYPDLSSSRSWLVDFSSLPEQVKHHLLSNLVKQ